jgi:Insertion element 4 transposase N-terminal/Transposase DDE domain
LPSKSDTVTLTRAITVAAGVYAPGHLGELTQHVPFELVDAVLAETGTVQRRLRVLPSRVGVYLVLAMGLFEQVGLAGVWAKLVGGLSAAGCPCPSEKALRDLRRRVGAEPLAALFRVLAGPLAQPRTPGTRYRGFRTVAFDGCCSIKAADHARVRGWLGKPRHRLGLEGYPRLMLVALVETGTRGLLGAVFGPIAPGERAYARRLLHLLGPGMLLLDDRGFDGEAMVADLHATGAHLLLRFQAKRRLPVCAPLPDGSYLTCIRGLTLRVIEVAVTVSGADASTVRERYRLVTTLTDHRLDPAAVLMRLYHERWEIESAYYALRHTLLAGRVLRSQDPTGLTQELWALLCLYQLLRRAMADAAEHVPGTDPDRASFTVALHAARESVIRAENIAPERPDPVGAIGRAVLARLLPPRRPRFSQRRVKSPRSRYALPDTTGRPRASTTITAIDTTILHPLPADTPQLPATGAQRVRTPRKRRPTRREHLATGAPPEPTPTLDQVLALLRQDPNQPRRARHLAAQLGIVTQESLNTISVRMTQWAKRGLIAKTAPATYKAPEPEPLTHTTDA